MSRAQYGKLTDQELREPYVTWEFPYSQWGELPEAIRKELRLYADRGNGVVCSYTIPAYLYRKFLEMAKVTP